MEDIWENDQRHDPELILGPKISRQLGIKGETNESILKKMTKDLNFDLF